MGDRPTGAEGIARTHQERGSHLAEEKEPLEEEWDS
jgi:hypothetical protein